MHSDNIRQLLLALVVTLFVWVVHTLSLEYTSMIQCSVRVSANMVGYEASALSNEPLLFRATTTGYRMMRLKGFGGDRYVIDIDLNRNVLERMDGSDTFFRVRVSEIRDKISAALGGNVSADYFDTDYLTFFFRKQGFKKVPVIATSSVSYRSQYMPVRELTVSPDSVLAYGSVSELEGLNEVHTNIIYHRGVGKNIQGYVSLDKGSGLVRFSQDKVLYSINVVRYVETSQTVDIKVRNLPAGKSLILLPSKTQVTYRFPFDHTARTSPEIEVYVDYDECAAQTGTKTIPHMEAPGTDIFSCSFEPRMVEFIVVDEG